MYSKYLKRIFDVFGSLIAITILSPLLILLFFIIRSKMGTPVIFSQPRPGLKGKTFTFYKFRTMTDKCDKRGKLLPDKERTTPLGNYLRESSLDELISLYNVLKGDMSLVGPRPLMIAYLNLYSREQARRHDVKPGITGWAQVNGRNSISWKEKFSYDVWYVNNYSFLLDLKILLITILKVINREGINQSNEVTMEKFNGNN